MRYYIILLLILFTISIKSFSQIKFGSNGVGYSIWDKNQVTIRINPNKIIGKKKEITTEFQFNKTVYSDNYNKFYIGLGGGYTWVNLHEIGGGFIVNDYNTQQFYIPIGFEYFPLESNKVSFQLEVRPVVELSLFELNPNRTLQEYYYPKALIEINYYFRRNSNR